jgi:hypothetical protein
MPKSLELHAGCSTIIIYPKGTVDKCHEIDGDMDNPQLHLSDPLDYETILGVSVIGSEEQM